MPISWGSLSLRSNKLARIPWRSCHSRRVTELADAAQAVALSSALAGDLEKAKGTIRCLLELVPSRPISTALVSKHFSPEPQARIADIPKRAGMPEQALPAAPTMERDEEAC